MYIISRKDGNRRRVKGHGLEHKGYTNGRLGGDRKHNKIKIKFDSRHKSLQIDILEQKISN